MKTPKKRTKKYRPKPVFKDGGLVVIAQCHARGEDATPMNDEQMTDVGLAYWLSLEQLRAGDATEEAWSCIVLALNVGLTLTKFGYSVKDRQAFEDALEGAFRAKMRSARTGNFRLDGDAMRDITHALSLHDKQIEAIPRVEIKRALVDVYQEMEKGNVYREAA